MKSYILALPIVAGVAGLAAAADDNRLADSLWIVALVVVLAGFIIWLSIALAGRRHFSQVDILGDRLICRQDDLFNRGRIRTFFLRDITGWEKYSEQGRYGRGQGIAFVHDGWRYRITLTDADYVDDAALDDLLRGRP